MIIAPLIVGAIFFRSFSLTIKLLYAFVFATATLELISGLMMLNHQNNLALFHAHVYIEFVIITLMFFLTYDSIWWRGVSILFLIFFLTYSAINACFYEGMDIFNSNQRYVEGLLILTMCVGYYITLMRRPVHRYLEQQPMFWLTSGFLIYFAGTLYLFLFMKELMAIDNFDYWEIHSILNIGLNVIFVVAFMKERKL